MYKTSREKALQSYDEYWRRLCQYFGLFARRRVNVEVHEQSDEYAGLLGPYRCTANVDNSFSNMYSPPSARSTFPNPNFRSPGDGFQTWISFLFESDSISEIPNRCLRVTFVTRQFVPLYFLCSMSGAVPSISEMTTKEGSRLSFLGQGASAKWGLGEREISEGDHWSELPPLFLSPNF